MIEIKKITDVSDGDIVAQDIYLGRTLLIAKGSVLKPDLIRRLKKYEVTEVPVRIADTIEAPIEQAETVQEGVSIQPFLAQLNKLMEQQAQKGLNAREQLISGPFFEDMKHICSESRYGLAFNHSERLTYVYELWQTLLRDHYYYQLMRELRQWDLPTYFHSLDTFILGSLFVKHIGMGSEHLFSAACLLHDIGKLRVPHKILANENKLTTEEFEIIKMHVEYGVQLLAEHEPDSPIIPIVKQHHERMDGSGYPDGRIGNQIELFARILMIIDVYSALTLERPYRKPLSGAKALEVMLHESYLYDLYFLREFMQMLHIYPVDATLELTNHNIVVVTDVNPQFPYLPTVTNKEQGYTYQIPHNLSISVRRLLSWQGMNHTKKPDRFVMEELQHLYQNHLLLGEAGKAVSLIQSLTRSLPHETILFQVIMQTMKLIQQMQRLGALKEDCYQTACIICQEVLDHFSSAVRANDHPRKDERLTILLVPLPHARDNGHWPLKIVSEAFVFSGWRTIPLETFPSMEELLDYAHLEHVRYICVVPTDHEDIQQFEDTLRLLKQKSKMVLTICTEFMDTIKIKQNDPMIEIVDFYAELPVLIERIHLYEQINQERNVYRRYK